MRVPKFIEPDELPPRVEVRTFSGDLVTVYRPEPIDRDFETKAMLCVNVTMILAGLMAFAEPDGPLGIAALAPVAHWINVATTVRSPLDGVVRFALLILTFTAAVKLGFWLLWRFQLMRYAAKVEDETT